MGTYCLNCKQNVKAKKKALLKTFLVYIAVWWLLFFIFKSMTAAMILGLAVAIAYYYRKKPQCPICKDSNFK